jgi:hypothetical protein
MESHIINSQIRELKDNLVRNIKSSTVNDPETKAFSSVVSVVYLNNPELVCNIYGIKNGILLFDCMNTSIEHVEMNLVDIEALIRIKEQLEYFEKSKQFSSPLQQDEQSVVLPTNPIIF